jgi:hypothetical protein
MRKFLLIASAGVVIAGATTTAIVASSVSGNEPTEAKQECVKSCSDAHKAFKSECAGHARKHHCPAMSETEQESADLK